VVRSTFDLPVEQRAAIQNALNETVSAEIRVRFETAPDLISGIELTSNGQKVAWSIADYLVSLEKGVDELLKEKDKPDAKTAPKPESKPEVKAEAKAKPEPESKPEAETEAKPESTPESKPEVKAEAKPKPEPESKPEAETVAKPESKPEPKPEAETEAKPKTEPEEAKPGTKGQ
jgi:F-type H+-transporting ATPase subunit b